MGVWDYGIAIGALATLFALFTWVIKFLMNTSSDREKRAEAREKVLLDALNDIVEKNGFVLERQGDVLDKQCASISQLSTQIADVSQFIMCLKQEFGELRTDIRKGYLYVANASTDEKYKREV